MKQFVTREWKRSALFRVAVVSIVAGLTSLTGYPCAAFIVLPLLYPRRVIRAALTA